MKTFDRSVWLFVLFAVGITASPAWAKEGSDEKTQTQVQGLNAVEKSDALAPGEEAPDSVMKDTPAVPLKVAAVITGDVLSVDPAKSTFTVKEDGTGKRRTLSAINSDILRTLKKGNRVRVSIPDGSQTNATVFKA